MVVTVKGCVIILCIIQSTYFNVLYACFIIRRKIRIGPNTRILLLHLTYGRTMH